MNIWVDTEWLDRGYAITVDSSEDLAGVAVRVRRERSFRPGAARDAEAVIPFTDMEGGPGTFAVAVETLMGELDTKHSVVPDAVVAKMGGRWLKAIAGEAATWSCEGCALSNSGCGSLKLSGDRPAWMHDSAPCVDGRIWVECGYAEASRLKADGAPDLEFGGG